MTLARLLLRPLFRGPAKKYVYRGSEQLPPIPPSKI
jgi:hypothetical protein